MNLILPAEYLTKCQKGPDSSDCVKTNTQAVIDALIKNGNLFSYKQ